MRLSHQNNVFAAIVVGCDQVHNLPVELVPDGTMKRGKLWLHNGFSYVKNRESKSGILYMHCRMVKVCKAAARLNNQTFIVSGYHTCQDQTFSTRYLKK